MRHLPVLDGIRGLSIISVMLYHFTIPFQNSTAASSLDRIFQFIFGFGWLGVDLFFLMSGFLITNILLKARSQPNYFLNFYVRRFLRIFPLYYGLLIVFFLVLPFLTENIAGRFLLMRENSIWFWTYLVNLRIAYLGDFNNFQGGYMWSLAVEEQFYCVWPLIVYYFHKNIVKISVVTITTFALLRPLLLAGGLSSTSIYTLTFTHLDGLLLGSIIAVFFQKNQLSALHLKRYRFSALGSLIIVAGISFYQGNFLFYKPLVAGIGLFASAIVFAFSLLVILKSPQQSKIFKFFSLRPLTHMGSLCYGLYLLHQPIGSIIWSILGERLNLLAYGLLGILASTTLAFIVSYFAALFSFHLYEKHFLKLKKHFV